MTLGAEARCYSTPLLSVAYSCGATSGMTKYGASQRNHSVLLSISHCRSQLATTNDCCYDEVSLSIVSMTLVDDHYMSPIATSMLVFYSVLGHAYDNTFCHKHCTFAVQNLMLLPCIETL